MAKQSKHRKSKNKSAHLTIVERSKIEYGLNKGHSIRAIAKEIGKNPTSVMREIQRNGSFYTEKDLNDCAFRDSCTQTGVCGRIDCHAKCSKRCRKTCFKQCSLYMKVQCEKIQSAPYVCNGCSSSRIGNCPFDKCFYRAEDAQKLADEQLHERNAGFDLSLEELNELDRIITPAILKGQSPYHVVQSNLDNISVSVSTVYRLIEAGALGAKSIDLKEKVKRKERKSRRQLKHAKRVAELKLGRQWEDYLDYMEENDVIHPQMDCVEGIRDESCAILTLHWAAVKMQLGFYLETKDAWHVVGVFDEIEQVLGTELFQLMFPIILTDNGVEFDDIIGMERSVFDPNVKRTHIFFCEPNRSDEKGACENNHKRVRDIFPKGKSLAGFTQAEVTLAFNNINSYRRNSQFGKCPYELARQIFPEEFFDLLGLYQIKDTEVELTPKLIKNYRHGQIQPAAPEPDHVDLEIEVPEEPLTQLRFVSQD